MKWILIVLALCVALDAKSLKSKSEIPNRQILKTVTDGIEKFSLTLLLRTAIDSGIKNVVINPYNTWSTLSLLCRGAKDQTLQQLLRVLHHPEERQGLAETIKFIHDSYLIDAKNVDITSKNFIISNINEKLSKEFEDAMTVDTQILPLDLNDPNAHTRINGITNLETRGQIDDIVDKDDLKKVALLLLNAIYFQAAWAQPFNSIFTTKQPFYDFNNKKIGSIDMMVNRGHYKYGYVEGFQADVLELPLGRENRMCILIVTPRIGVSMMNFFKRFTYVPISQIFQTIDKENSFRGNVKVEVHIPKFNTTTHLNINQILYNMGIQDVFDEEAAMLPGVVTDNAWISKIIQKSKFEMIEGSTSDIVFDDYMDYHDVNKYIVNRPFLYMIVEKATNVVMMEGIFTEPESV